MQNELNYKLMVEDIDKEVQTDFAFDMSNKLGFGHEFTQEDAKGMAQIINAVYTIAHCNTCKACNKKYL